MYPKDDEIDEEQVDDDEEFDEDEFDDGDVLDCPSCGQTVYDDTDRCPHCGDWIMPLAASAEKPVWMRLVSAIVILALLFGVIRGLSLLLF